MRFLRRVLPSPLWSASLLVLWLFAIVVPIITAKLRPAPGRVRRPMVIVHYLLTVGYDILLSNLEVAWGVVGRRWHRPRSKFVVIPLELRDPRALAALAMVTTVVPGTLWSELAVDRSSLLLHVWHVDDEHAFIMRYKSRYEQPLREIFE